jgi:putative membrane protein
VKQFAQKMIDDHTKAGARMKTAIAQAGGDLKAPAALDPERKAALEKLSSASGDTFDKEYVDTQVKGHDKAVELFSAYAQGGDNPDLKAFAQATLHTVKMHRQMIHAIDQKMS